jgi:spermidine/putrescine transport system ATP-binding protein
MSRERPEPGPGGANVVAGHVRHGAYLGSETVYEVVLGSGQAVKVLRSNSRRYEEQGFGEGDAVWLSWHAGSPVVLLS